MGALAISLVVIAAIVFLALVLLILSRRSPAQSQQAVGTMHPSAPKYTQQSQHTEYYRPKDKKGRDDAAPSRPAKRDRRDAPLPRCPLCNAAVGFDDDRCPKCKYVLKDL